MTDVRNPRTTGREAIKASVPRELWAQNERFTAELVAQARAHRLTKHPILALLDGGASDLDLARFFHLEFRHAFAQIFTDSIAHAMVTCSQLEPRLGAGGKVSARFLLQLNLLDELGFCAAVDGATEYCGNPALAHYLQFDATLKQLGLTDADLRAFKPSTAAVAARASFESTYGDHKRLIALLAVAETVFADFAGPWARNTGHAAKIDVSKGYHAIHVEQGDGSFVDDDHSEDSYYLVRQAVQPADYAAIKHEAGQWLDSWAGFCDNLVEAAAKAQKAV